MALPALMFVILAATLLIFILFVTTNMWEIIAICAAIAIVYWSINK